MAEWVGVIGTVSEEQGTGGGEVCEMIGLSVSSFTGEAPTVRVLVLYSCSLFIDLLVLVHFSVLHDMHPRLLWAHAHLSHVPL